MALVSGTYITTQPRLENNLAGYAMDIVTTSFLIQNCSANVCVARLAVLNGLRLPA